MAISYKARNSSTPKKKKGRKKHNVLNTNTTVNVKVVLLQQAPSKNHPSFSAGYVTVILS